MASTKSSTKSSTPTLSPEDKRAAANAAAAERRKIAAAIKKADLKEKPSELTPEQRQRAAESGEKKAGLSGKALAGWIMEGVGTRQQANRGRAAAEAKAGEERQRKNATRSSDPTAADLAKAAQKLGAGGPNPVKSAILPKDAREFLDVIMKRGANDGTVDGLLSREVPGEAEGETRVVSVSLKTLKEFAVDDSKDKDVRAHLVALGEGSRLWGRKLALLMLAHREAAK